MVDSRQRIIAANAAAKAAGIEPGMLSGSALAVCSHLLCLPRQPRAEEALLHSLACWAIQFSPRVSLAPPGEVVLEVGGSLRLFQSLEGLQQAVQQALENLNYTVYTGMAPIPLAAQILSRAHDPRPVLHSVDLPDRLNPLPLNLMAWPEKTQQRIAAIGVHSLGACTALPRAGFIKRYGQLPRTQLDQLWGLADDPREVFTPPARFVRSLDLLSETERLDYLIPGFEKLFAALSAQLQGMGCGVLSLHISLAHGRRPRSRLHLSLQQPSRDARHWLDLLRHRFERLKLAEPVRAIQLRAGDFISLGHGQISLWAQADSSRQQALLEQLAARLGPGTLYGLSSCSSHCPEQAWQRSDAGQGRDDAADSRPRPLWLLHQAVPIAADQLGHFSAPERLETSWWDSSCQRDYYRARTPQGQQVWIYRDHARADQWMLHGLFG